MTWATRAITSFLVFLAMLATTAWLPGGLTYGVRRLGLSTATVLSLTCAAGIALATLTLAAHSITPRFARGIVIGLGLTAWRRFFTAP